MEDLLNVLFPVQVLLVDDDEEARRALRRSLEEQGFTVVEAVSGLEALTILEQSHVPVDLLISDVQMPGMRGDELVRRIRRGCPDLPVLYVSGEPAFARLVETTPGPCHFLGKPYSVSDLLGAVQQALDTSDPWPGLGARPTLGQGE